MKRRPTGTRCINSALSTAPVVVDVVSTTAVVPVTCTTSVRPPTSSCRLTVVVWPRLTVSAPLLNRLEALQLGADVVAAGRQERDPVGPVGVGHRGLGALGACRRDGDARQCQPL